MCGICGFASFSKPLTGEDTAIVERMNARLRHRGPDAQDTMIADHVALGFSRLSIIGLSNGMQPITNEDGSLLLVCNGEIFNYIELRDALKKKGHIFYTDSDVEVIVHLYEDNGCELLHQLNGQFAFALYDRKKKSLFCARDHMGILPFYFTKAKDTFVFGSEIKAILEHPLVDKEVDVTGLDQVLTFPGLISPRTMFRNIFSLENGHYLTVDNGGQITNREYWDLNYPQGGIPLNGNGENYYIEKLEELLEKSIRLRMRSDVPVGIYLSGGLDSSMIAMKLHQLYPTLRQEAFCIDFPTAEMSEAPYQALVANKSNSNLNRKIFFYKDISERLRSVIYHCECPLKETYNTASMSLSESTRSKGIRVILSGEGPDELFAGYPSYRFDQMKREALLGNSSLSVDQQLRKKVWGDEHLFYETDFAELNGIKQRLYASGIRECFEDVDCLNAFVVDKEKLAGRDPINKRSYLDYKLRLVDHLVTDHGDKMALANSIEVRYPFLDKELVEFSATLPQQLKLNGMREKYILKRMASKFVPEAVVSREKFGFVAPGSPYLLRNNIEYIYDLLSYDLIRKQGFFDPDEIETLKKTYSREGFSIAHPFEKDLLITVITFGIFLEQFF